MPAEIASRLRKAIGGDFGGVVTGQSLPEAMAASAAAKQVDWDDWLSRQEKSTDRQSRSRLWLGSQSDANQLARLRQRFEVGDSFGGGPACLSIVGVSPLSAQSSKPVQQLSANVPERTLLLISGRRVLVEGEGVVTWHLPPATNAKDKLPRPTEITQPAGEALDLTALTRTAASRLANHYPPDVPPASRIDRGTLILGGGGDLPDDVWQTFIESAGGPEAPIVFITSAQPDPFEPNPKGTDRLKALGAKNTKVFGHRSLADATPAEADTFYRALRAARGVWLMGGRQWRYIDAYEGTPVPQLLRDVLSRGGVVGGTSAGAAILADVMVRGSPLNNRTIFDEGYLRGFGLLPGATVDIHVSERQRFAEFAQAGESFPRYLKIAIDEATAAIVRGQTIKAVGSNVVRVIRPGENQIPGVSELKNDQLLTLK